MVFLDNIEQLELEPRTLAEIKASVGRK